MISYQVYKVLHLASIFFFVSGAAVLLLSDRKGKFWKLLTCIASFFILFAGFGMLARLQIPVSQGWVIGKIVIWLVVTGLGHMVAKRFPAKGMAAYWVTIILATIAGALAVYKP